MINMAVVITMAENAANTTALANNMAPMMVSVLIRSPDRVRCDSSFLWVELHWRAAPESLHAEADLGDADLVRWQTRTSGSSSF
jgi:hypothetical protein